MKHRIYIFTRRSSRPPARTRGRSQSEARTHLAGCPGSPAPQIARAFLDQFRLTVRHRLVVLGGSGQRRHDRVGKRQRRQSGEHTLRRFPSSLSGNLSTNPCSRSRAVMFAPPRRRQLLFHFGTKLRAHNSQSCSRLHEEANGMGGDGTGSTRRRAHECERADAHLPASPPTAYAMRPPRARARLRLAASDEQAPCVMPSWVG